MSVKRKMDANSVRWLLLLLGLLLMLLPFESFAESSSAAAKNNSTSATYTTTVKSSEGSPIAHDWIVVISIIMTALIFLLGLVGCLCLCHDRCDCKNTVYTENGEVIRQRFSRSASLPTYTSSTDFDPNSPYAFAPPSYDTLAKDPPAYCEIFTISHRNTDDDDRRGSRSTTSVSGQHESRRRRTASGSHRSNRRSANSNHDRRHQAPPSSATPPSTPPPLTPPESPPPPPYTLENDVTMVVNATTGSSSMILRLFDESSRSPSRESDIYSATPGI